MSIKNILIFSFSRIGDVVLSTAVIPPLKKRYPDAKISILVGSKAWEILWGDIRINEIIIYDNRGRHSGVNGKIRLIKELRAKKFDLVIDLRDSLWSHFVGKQRLGIPLFHRFSSKYRELHAVDRYLDILRNDNIDCSNAVPIIPILTYERQKAVEYLAQNGVKRHDIVIGIHPGGSWQYKLWPVKRFAGLGDFLCQKYEAKILVFAGSDEIDLQMQMFDLMKIKPIIIQGLGLRDLAAIIQQCHIYIGNDTGPMHIAAAVGTRVISLFGSTAPNRSGPYGNGHIVISKKIDCSPCHPGSHPGGCKRGSCIAMDSISLAQVTDTVERVINAQKQHISY